MPARSVREELYTIEQWRADAASGKLKEAFACGTAAVISPIGKVCSVSGDFHHQWWREAGPVAMGLRKTAGRHPVRPRCRIRTTGSRRFCRTQLSACEHDKSPRPSGSDGIFSLRSEDRTFARPILRRRTPAPISPVAAIAPSSGRRRCDKPCRQSDPDTERACKPKLEREQQSQRHAESPIAQSPR